VAALEGDVLVAGSGEVLHRQAVLVAAGVGEEGISAQNSDGVRINENLDDFSVFRAN
jgi:hypothetical protein